MSSLPKNVESGTPGESLAGSYQATATLALAGSAHLTAMASVCRSVCEDCKAACAPNVEAHAEGKACHEACTAMLAALDGLG